MVKSSVYHFLGIQRHRFWLVVIAAIHLIQPCRLYRTVAYTMALSLSSIGHGNETITPTRGGMGDLNTSIDKDGKIYNITGGTRPNNGPNLFHSFDQFSIFNGDTANFKNDNPGLKTNNILSRVVGGNISTIEGTIKATGFPDTNIYLLNPAGFLFGSGVNIDVDGAFFASTADFVEFANGARFNTDASPIDAQLAVALPAAFGFLPETEVVRESQGIRIKDSFLSFADTTMARENFTLIGSPIVISNVFATSSSRSINVVSPGRATARIENGEIGLEKGQPGGSVILDNAFLNAGDIHLLGETIQLTKTTVLTSQDDGNSGDIVFSARDTIDIDDSNLTTSSTGMSSGNISLWATHGVTLRAENSTTVLSTDSGTGGSGNIDITVKDGDINLNNSVLQAEVKEGASARIGLIANNGMISLGERTIISSRALASNAGDVNISARVLAMNNGAKILGETIGLGEGASISIEGDVIYLSDNGTTITSETSGEGKAGSVTLKAGDVKISDGALVTAKTTGQGEGGRVTINAPTVTLTGGGRVTTDSTDPQLNENNSIAGNAGSIKIVAGRFVVQDLAEVSATTSTAGIGGSIDIEATDIQLRDHGLITAKSTGSGNSGSINIKKADTVSLLDNSEITAKTEIVEANAGDITINAKTLLHLHNNSTIETSASVNDPDGRGSGGNIIIDPKVVVLDGASKILAKAQKGKGGSIIINNADTVRLLDNSEITVRTEKAEANAGDITINAKTLLHLRNNSIIETSAAVNDPDGRGSGGNITIDPKIVVLDGASKILAKAQKGKGGNIKITITDGGALFKSLDSVIDASAGPAGIDGTVEIIRTDSDVTRGTLVLPESFLDAAKLLSEKCMARTAAGASSFVVSGRSGVPPGPDALLPDYVSVLDEVQPGGEQVDETAFTLPVSNLGSTQNRLNQLIIECNPS